MPYTADTVPDHVPPAKARAWAARWNAAYGQCQQREGDDCEGYAFRVANALLKEKAMLLGENERLIDLFGAIDPAAWVRILPIGTFQRFGREVNVTADMVQEMAGNFGRVPETTVPVNAEHDGTQGKLADVVAVEARPDGLWAKLGNFIADAAARIAAGAFQYLSPEIAWGPVDFDGAEHSNVLLGLALTNLPYFGKATALYSLGGALEGDVDTYAVWTSAFINDLPDKSFLWIESGGAKDEGGKTTPRSLRHLPVKDADGKVDAAHARNAIARAPQMKDKNGKQVSPDFAQQLQAKARQLLERLTGKSEANLLGGSDMSEEMVNVPMPARSFWAGIRQLFGAEGSEGGDGEQVDPAAALNVRIAELEQKLAAGNGEAQKELDALKAQLAEMQARAEKAEKELGEAKAEAEFAARVAKFGALGVLNAELPKVLATMPDAEAQSLFESLKATIEQDKFKAVLTEVGGNAHGVGGEKDPVAEFNAAVRADMEQYKLSYGDAMSKVAREKPELYERYKETVREGQ